ncbi:MAG: ribonuclease D [Anaerolineae bacterium]|nr:ribonuclease D [Anaerolineae bacterium]
MNQLPPATMITSTASLVAHVDRWAGESLLAIDTESNSLHAYHEQVCLIQVSTRQADFIIDPLRIENLDALGRLLADPAIEIVFHAAEYDIMCLKRDFGFSFARLFDTMLAARICGVKRLGLASMLEEHFGIQANKKYQRANWGERPLTPEMLQYAQLDTHFLPQLHDYWQARLVQEGRWEEASESFARLCDIPPAQSEFDPEGYWRLNGAFTLPPRQIAALRELYLWREETARQRDCPPFKIMSDKTLLELAQSDAQRLQDLHGVSGMTDGQVRRYGPVILATIRRSQKKEPPRRPPAPPRPSDMVVARFEALHDWRKARAQQRGVESDVIISRDALWALARLAPRTVAEMAQIPELGAFKSQVYGEEILQVLARVGQGNGRS